MNPLYTPDNTRPAFELNWGLTLFWRDAPVNKDLWLVELQAATEPDSVRVLKHQITTNDASQFCWQYKTSRVAVRVDSFRQGATTKPDPAAGTESVLAELLCPRGATGRDGWLVVAKPGFHRHEAGGERRGGTAGL